MANDPTDPMVELKAMTAVAEALRGLDADATGRVVRWAAERFSVTAAGKPIAKVEISAPDAGSKTSIDVDGGRRFEHLGDLHAATSPGTDADRALVAGYWFQFIEGHSDFGAQAINSALKNLGHGVANITTAFETLKAQKPQLVIQIKKAGTSKQARKTYKLTTAGKNAVESMITDHTDQ